VTMAPPLGRTRTGRWRGAAIAAVLAVAVAACSSNASQPAASTMLEQSAQAMRSVTTAHFSFTINGKLSSALPVKSAEGTVTRAGQAQATAILSLFGSIVTYQVVISGGTAYLKGPTGGYQSEPAADIYNVSQLLDPNNGVAGLLAKATGGRTIRAQTVDGTPSYEVQAEVPATILQGLTKLAPGQNEVRATLWIARSGHQLVQFRLPFTVAQATQPTVLTAMLSDFNAAVNIQAPPTS
jgi:lipoprotein LprG